MQVTQAIYNTLFNFAKRKSFGDEDAASEAVNKAILALPNYSGNCNDQFYAFTRDIIKHHIIDEWRKKKTQKRNFIFNCMEDEFLDLANKVTDENEDYLYEELNKYATKEEMDWMLEYMAMEYKIAEDRMKFHRLSKKLKKLIETKGKKQFRYTLLKNGVKYMEFNTLCEIGIEINRNKHSVQIALKENRKINKIYLIKRNF